MTPTHIIGRKQELKQILNKIESPRAEFIVLYGRRRVGKSLLIQEISKKFRRFSVEGLENARTPKQIAHFTIEMKNQFKDTTLGGLKFTNWDSILQYLTQWISRSDERTIIAFDELQWLAANRSDLIHYLKIYWDNHWKFKNVTLILCGSIASFMIQKVIHSKALYGRITLELPIHPMPPKDAALFFKCKRSTEEALKYLLIFGGVPKYLSDIDLRASFNQNINRLCFQKTGLMTQEFERIFYSQFHEAQNYIKIVKAIKERPMALDEISVKTKIASGGGLKGYLDNLEKAEFIEFYTPYDRGMKSKLIKYRLSDEYLSFYFKFIFPNLHAIKKGQSTHLFEKLILPKWLPWLGLAFERYCLKYAHSIAERWGFLDEVLLSAPYYGKADQEFQIDLLFKRADQVLTLCEIKYQFDPVGPEVIPEVERKCRLIKVPRGITLDRGIISASGITESLKKSGYFSYTLDAEGLLGIT